MENIAKKFLELHPDLEKVEFIYVDFNGIPRGKNASPKTLVKAFDGGLRMPISSYVLDVWGDNPKGTGLVMSGDGDAICRPVASSLAVTPWSSRNTAQCLVSMESGDGEPIYADQGISCLQFLIALINLILSQLLHLKWNFILSTNNYKKMDTLKCH